MHDLYLHRRMTRWMIVLVMSTYVCSATELHQLFKLPALFAHYAEDLAERPDEGFICFLADHYFDGAHSEAEEHEDHGDLPFQCQHDCIGHVAQIAVPNALNSMVVDISPISVEFPLANDASYSFLLSRDVWQPPKA